jgi:hypothetical protein
MPDSQLQATLTQILSVLTSLEQLVQEFIQQKNVTKSKRKKSRTELYSQDFMIAWKLYGKKVGKLAAAKAYEAFRKRQMKSCFYIKEGFQTPDEMLLKKIAAFTEAWPPTRIQTGDFRPHLSTFINQDRWMEEPSDWTDPDANFQEQGGPVWTE